MYSGFAIRQRGQSHIAKGILCQDGARYHIDTVGDGYAIAAVSDGHGGEKYFRSRVGAFVAVHEAIVCLREFLAKHRQSLIDVERREKRLKGIEGHIISHWRGKLETFFAKSPLKQHEKDICDKHGILPDIFQAQFYGATLLYACMTPDYSFASQIGDGACVFIDADGKPEIPDSLADSRLGFGLTTSLCDTNAADNFRRHFVSATEGGSPKAVFLYTDGVVDSYERASFLTDFNRSVFDEMNKDKKNAVAQLRDWLPKLSQQGSQDDVSMAGVYRHDDAEGQEV